MNIHIRSFANCATWFTEKAILPLTVQQQKILIVATVAFALLAAYCLAKQYCFKAESLRDELVKDETKAEPLRDEPVKDEAKDRRLEFLRGLRSVPVFRSETIINLATNHFRRDPHKDAIIEKVKEYLERDYYEEFINKKEEPVIAFDWKEVAQDRVSDYQIEITHKAREFLKGFGYSIKCVYLD